jgi:hypothetical protein
MVGVRVQWEDSTWNHSAHRPTTQRDCSVHQLRPVGFALLVSSFHMLLENYGLQLHHLTPHTLALVAIFIHLCEMYVGVQTLMRLFRLFFSLRSFGRSPNHLGAYYF